MSEQIRIYLLEDHQIVRQGLAALLQTQDNLELIGESGSGLEAVKEIARLEPTLYLCDLGLPDLPGLEVIQQLKALSCPSAALVLSMYRDPHWVQRAFEVGARGYLVKGSGISDLLSAVSRVAAGERFCSEELPPDPPRLSPREEEVLSLVALGHTSREISGLLQISPRTAEKHRARVMEKLKINDVAGLTRYAVRTGLIDSDLR